MTSVGRKWIFCNGERDRKKFKSQAQEQRDRYTSEAPEDFDVMTQPSE